MIALTLLIAAAAAAGGAAEERVFVFSFSADGVDKKIVDLLEQEVTRTAADAGFTTVSSAEMQQLLDVEAAKQAAGCDGGASCLSEIAGSLGASLVISGSVTRAGGQSVLSLVLFDATSKVLARESVEADKSSQLRPLARGATRRLLGVEKKEEEEQQASSSPALAIGGGVTLGVGVLAAGVGLVPLVLAQQAQNEAVAADAAGDIARLGQAHDAYEQNAAGWNSWGVLTVGAGGALVVTGAVVLTLGLLPQPKNQE